VEGDFFIHPTFGVGQVQVVKPERMVVVLFETGEERTMIHAR
jgi:transcription elongation factor GreA-like protein